jgi:FecR protein
MALWPFGAALSASPVGDAASVVQNVSGELSGRRRAVRQGEKVFQDETIRTERDSQARLVLLDRTSLWIGSLAALKLDRFVYDANGPSSSVVVSALKGAVRWASGALPSASYKINTPHVALGIRGTTFDVLVGPTETVIVLVEGAVSVCPTRRASACHTLDRPGAVAIGNSGGVQGPNSNRSRTLDLPSLYQRLGGNFLAQPAPTQLGEVPGLPGVRMDAARYLGGPQLPATSGGLVGGEGSSISGGISVGSGGIGLGSGAPGGALGGGVTQPAAAQGSVGGAGAPSMPSGPALPAAPSLPSLPQLSR